MQLEADLLGQQGQVAAGLLRVTPAQLVGHVAFMRAYVLGRSGDGEVTGVVRGESAARALALAAGWTGDVEEFISTLADPAVGLLERLPDGLLVRGMEPYEKARRKSEASKERVRKSREARRLRATRANVQDKKKTESKTETDEEKPSAVAAAPTGASGQASLLPEAKAPEKPARKQPDSEHHALWRALEAEYQRVMGRPYASGNSGADAKAVQWLRETAKATPDDAVRRWGRLLEWSKGGFPSVTGFASLRQHWVAPQVLGATRPKNSQSPTMPTHNWDEGLPPVHRPAEEQPEPF
jgi:hypothetical protein